MPGCFSKYNVDDFSIEFDNDPMVCIDCKFRKKDFVVNGQVVIEGYSNTTCYKFENEKPKSVLSGSNCHEYIKE